MDHLAIGFAAEGAASGGHHDIIELSTPRQFVALGGPEGRLAASGEYLCDRGTESSTDLLIEIDEAKAQAIRQRGSDRALSGTHETDKENARHTQ
jgi:hypothetical protein